MAEIDLIIRGAKVIDGTGNPWKYGDVLVSGQQILDVTPPGVIASDQVGQVIDATGMIVCPGFIDIQSHSIVPLMRDGRCVSKITQGVTTEIMGEAWTPAPVGGRFTDPMGARMTSDDVSEWEEKARGWTRFSDWLNAMVDSGVSPNVGSFVGGGTLRQYGRGMDIGAANAEELATMKKAMAEAMEDGAFGISYALIYPPDNYAPTEEIIEVCKIVAQYNGVYITHMRSESDQILEGLAEAIEIGDKSGAAVEIYHLKASGESCWHLMPEVIKRITDARARGLDITSDMYPYVASGTGFSSILPTWVAEGGKFFENLKDPEVRKRLHQELTDPNSDYDGQARSAGLENIMPVGFRKQENQQYVGKRLSEIVEMTGKHWVDTVIDLLISEGHRISTIYFKMSEENIRLQLQQPWIKVSSDAGGLDPEWAIGDGPTHPRAYGTYTRVLGKYVREEGLLSLEDAIRKMTSSVADRLSINDRGQLKAGQFADIVIFDPETVIDNSTFEDPHHLSTGIQHVWVNGTQVVQDGEHTGARPGHFVKGPGAR